MSLSLDGSFGLELGGDPTLLRLILAAGATVVGAGGPVGVASFCAKSERSTIEILHEGSG